MHRYKAKRKLWPVHPQLHTGTRHRGEGCGTGLLKCSNKAKGSGYTLEGQVGRVLGVNGGWLRADCLVRKLHWDGVSSMVTWDGAWRYCLRMAATGEGKQLTACKAIICCPGH
jgi:hypothetical protein